jgi:hypothetical protein
MDWPEWATGLAQSSALRLSLRQQQQHNNSRSHLSVQLFRFHAQTKSDQQLLKKGLNGKNGGRVV